jgi:hypothetical protein
MLDGSSARAITAKPSDEPTRSNAPTASPWHQLLDFKHDHLSQNGTRPTVDRAPTQALSSTSRPKPLGRPNPQQKHTPRT